MAERMRKESKDTSLPAEFKSEKLQGRKNVGRCFLKRWSTKGCHSFLHFLQLKIPKTFIYQHFSTYHLFCMTRQNFANSCQSLGAKDMKWHAKSHQYTQSHFRDELKRSLICPPLTIYGNWWPFWIMGPSLLFCLRA